MPYLTHNVQTIYSLRLSFQIHQQTKYTCCPIPRKTNSRSCILNGGYPLTTKVVEIGSWGTKKKKKISGLWTSKAQSTLSEKIYSLVLNSSH